jgi:hypothetical protein
MLPKEAFVVFFIDPYMSADCALALTGLVQWAFDISEKQAANIRVLATSNYFGNNLLSELVSIRSQYPVVHYEIPIPTHVEVIPGFTIDNSEGDEIFDNIENLVLARDDYNEHAILFVPPLTRRDIFPTTAHSLSYNALFLKNINDTGPIMN